MQLKKLCGKSSRVYATHVLEAIENEAPRMEDLHVLQEFRDVFLMKFPRFPPKRDVDPMIEFVLGKAPVSKKPYRVSTP